DNVEHIFLTGLPAGRYDLQVEKNPTGQVSATERYALAYEFFNVELNIVRTNDSLAITWPLTPSGFALESAPLASTGASWTSVTAAVSINGNRNSVLLTPTAQPQFFRLRRP